MQMPQVSHSEETWKNYTPAWTSLGAAPVTWANGDELVGLATYGAII